MSDIEQEAKWAVQVVNLKAEIDNLRQVLASVRGVLMGIAEHPRGDPDDLNAAAIGVKLIDVTLEGAA